MTDYNTGNVLTNDLRVITGAKYNSMRKLSDLHALQILCETLAIKLAAQPASINPTVLSLRQIKLMQRTLDMHYSKIRKRITQVERMNDNKANKDRSNKARLQLFDAIAQSGVIGSLVINQRETRAQAMRESKEHAHQVRSDAVPAIQKQYADAGFNPLATSTEREEWARLRDTNRHAIPGTDLSEQGNEMMQRMQSIEQEREAKPAGSAQPSDSQITDDTSTIGTAEEWLDKL